MTRLLAVMVAFGLAIGFALPRARPAESRATAAAAGHEVVLTRGSSGHFFTDAKVNGRGAVHFIVDTGASMVALTVDDAAALGVPVDPTRFDVIGEGASGPVRGQVVMLDSIDVGGIKVEHVRAVVLENSSLSLLGQSFLESVDHVDMSGDYLSLRDGA